MDPLRYGMVGGGPGAFIGGVHRMAAALDGEYRLVAGAFSSTAGRSAVQGRELGLDPDRVHGSFEELIEAESALPPDERIEVVSIVTPNHLHHPAARAALEAGFHVVCDKPLTLTVEEAEDLCRLAAEHDRVFCVTHNYTGYPLVKEARELVRSGALGEVRKVVVEYSQGWLSTLLESEGHKQAEWRSDPAKAGISSALGDIGTHAHNLAEYVTGERVTAIFADLGSVVEGRTLEDDATLLLRLGGDSTRDAPRTGGGGADGPDASRSGAPPGIRGVLIASQVSLGERNHLRLRVYGSEGALDWCQEDPNDLRLVDADGTERILHTGSGALSEAATAHTRLPGGHPEGFIEAFANLYRNVARNIRARESGEAPLPFATDFPSVQDGARGVHFLHAAVRSGREGRWVDATYDPPGAGG
ncbi:MAG TPA: Gfo/Idh/MocA family oxidoreductase [Longimicrobiales bacterium]|nr:Gfo/Idh/MocA family oxidoreductase [Longimicrobiales bacterium]